MNNINTLNESNVKTATLYFDRSDDGLGVHYNHGRMEWFRDDNGMSVDIYRYSFWE